jgi:hypothetical protein
MGSRSRLLTLSWWTAHHFKLPSRSSNLDNYRLFYGTEEFQWILKLGVSDVSQTAEPYARVSP